MNLQWIARALLALLCGLQGAATAAIDLGRTHATHPKWPGHARFHIVWQTANVVLLSLIEIALILARGPWATQRFYLATILVGGSMLSFFIALFSKNLYGGTLSDPQGMPPWTIQMRGTQYRIDLNVLAEILGMICLAAIIAIFRFA